MRGSFFMAPDRTHMQRRRKMLLFMKVIFTQFIAEMGDKTQLMLVAMTSKFKLKWCGIKKVDILFSRIS